MTTVKPRDNIMKNIFRKCIIGQEQSLLSIFIEEDNLVDIKKNNQVPFHYYLKHLFDMKVISTIFLISLIWFFLFYPSTHAIWFSSIVILFSIVHTFSPVLSGLKFYTLIAASFMSSVSILFIFLVAMENMETTPYSSILVYGVLGLMGLPGPLIMADLVVNLKKINTGWSFRLTAAIIYVVSTTMMISSQYLGRQIPNTLKYIGFSSVMLAGVLLAVYSWQARDRKGRAGLYLHLSFISLISMPIFIKMLCEAISRPEMIQFI